MKRIISLALCVLMAVSLLTTGMSVAAADGFTYQVVTEDPAGNFYLDPAAPVEYGLTGEVGTDIVIAPAAAGVASADIQLQSGNTDIVLIEKISGTDYWRVHFKYAGSTKVWFEANSTQYAIDAQATGYLDMPNIFPYREMTASRETMMVARNQYGHLRPELDAGANSFYVICTDAGWHMTEVLVNTYDEIENGTGNAPWAKVTKIDDHIFRVELDTIPQDGMFVKATYYRYIVNGNGDPVKETNNNRFSMDTPEMRVEVLCQEDGEVFLEGVSKIHTSPNHTEWFRPFTHKPSAMADVRVKDPSVATVTKVPGENLYKLQGGSEPGYTTLICSENGVTYYADVYNAEGWEFPQVYEISGIGSQGKQINSIDLLPNETKMIRVVDWHGNPVNELNGDPDIVDVESLGSGCFRIRCVGNGYTALSTVDENDRLLICPIYCGEFRFMTIHRYQFEGGEYTYLPDQFSGIGRTVGNTVLVRPALNGVYDTNFKLSADDPDIIGVTKASVPGYDGAWKVTFDAPGETKLLCDLDGVVYMVNVYSHARNGSSERYLNAEIFRKDDNGEFFPSGYSGFNIHPDAEAVIRPFQTTTNKAVDVTSSDPTLLQASKIPGKELYRLHASGVGFATLNGTDEFGNQAYLNVYCAERVEELHARIVISYDPNTGKFECDAGTSNGYALGIGEQRTLRVLDEFEKPVSGLEWDEKLVDVRELGNGIYHITVKANGRTALYKADGSQLLVLSLNCGMRPSLDMHFYTEDGSREPARYGGIGRMKGTTIFIQPYLGDDVDPSDIKLTSADSSIVSVERVRGSDGMWKVSFVSPGETELRCNWDGEGYSMFVETHGDNDTGNDQGIRVEGLEDSVPYTGKAVTQVLQVYGKGNPLTEGKDYTVSYKNNKNVGDATVTIKFKGTYKKEKPITLSFHIYGIALDGLEVRYNNEPVDLEDGITVPFTGKAQKLIPALVNPENGVTLKAKTDYTITYEGKMTNVGEENYIVLTGKGGYEGQIRIPVRITTVDLSGAVISPIRAATFTGKAITPKLTVKLGKTTLKQGVHFMAEFSDNVNTGTAAVTIHGIGNYEGTCSAEFLIKGISISKAKMSGFVSSMPYEEGEEAVQHITLTYGGETLTEGEDYTVTYENNDGEGTATMYVNGEGNFHGTQFKKTFKITKVAIKKAKVSGLVSSMPYTGEEVTQEGYELVYTVKGAEPMVLEEGEDYTVRYEKNVKAGTATIYFDGCGRFSGTLKKTFKITPVMVADSDEIAIRVEDGVLEDGKPVTPEVSVYFKDEELTLGKDYTVKYSNNKAVASAEDDKAPTVTVTFKGSFKGKLTKTFNIT